MEVFQLNNQEPKSRVQRYNFNADDQRPLRRRHRQRRWWPWIMTLLTLAIAILLVLAINGHKAVSTHSTTASSSDSAMLAHASSASQASAYSQFQKRLDAYNDNGITVTQKQKLQKMIDQESNQAVQNREQKLLDQTKVSSTATTSSSSSAPTSSSAKKTSQNPTTFDTTHTFSSVGDAQNWAQASKNQWLQAGYNNYTITSDGQGNYNLQFVR
ncbi:hypothetical protein FD30_GL000808 [Levilactobacillus namurensis DSM 19117]|uniref:Uncharacterized protein n=1 Tax=Levilactobacillus namurensis DSM 19117 TaxID=1423773 RepID=A0A0R1JWH2_9LACO|nr:hypothetical protein FD30_GL000808 [Levilactobacillus namurensis DSM 19117]